ncbi:unnamed protein product [Aphanomyces euteiches]
MSADQVEIIFKKVLKEHHEEASAYSFSKLNADKQERIAKKMRLTTKLPDVKEPVDGSVVGFCGFRTLRRFTKVKEIAT